MNSSALLGAAEARLPLSPDLRRPERLLCLLNPHAAAGRAGALLPAVQAALSAHGLQDSLCVPRSVEEGRDRIATLAPGSRVLVLGGDGTLQQLLGALLAGRHTLALVPAGTGNDLARALGLRGLPWQQALERGLVAAPVAMDVGELCLAASGQCTTHHFLSSLTVGFDAAVGARAQQVPKWLRGLLRYLWATLAEIRQLQNHGLRLELDGVPVHEGETLIASCLNTPSYASGMPVAPGAQIDDGRLNLVLARGMGRARVLGLMPVMLAGQHGRMASVRLLPFAQMALEASSRLPLALDGEPIVGASNLQVRVLSRALSVVPGPAFSAAAH